MSQHPSAWGRRLGIGAAAALGLASLAAACSSTNTTQPRQAPLPIPALCSIESPRVAAGAVPTLRYEPWARLLLRDPPVAVLDEGSSALDGPTEAAVMEALLDASGGKGGGKGGGEGGAAAAPRRTTILIAHRLTLVAQRADLVFVFDGGRIVEAGPPELLLRERPNGFYAKLLRAQGLLPE